MSIVTGTYRGGKVELDSPVDWPEGVRVAVVPPLERIGLSEAEWVDTPENRQRLLERMNTFEPVGFTPEDEAEIGAAREAVKQVTLAAVRKQMGLEP